MSYFTKFFTLVLWSCLAIYPANANNSADKSSSPNSSPKKFVIKSTASPKESANRSANNNGNKLHDQNHQKRKPSNNLTQKNKPLSSENINKITQKSANKSSQISPPDLDKQAIKKPAIQTNNDQVNPDDIQKDLNQDQNVIADYDSTDYSKLNNKELISEKLWKKFSKTDIQILQSINRELDMKNYDEAMRLAKILKTNYGNQKNSLADAVIDIVLWNKFSKKFDVKKTPFTDISTFVIDNPYLPNITELRKNVEKSAIYNNVDYNLAEIYFNTNPALTPESKLFVVESKISKIASEKTINEIKDLKNKDIQLEIAKIWIKENFTEDLENKFLEKYKDILTEANHADRIERLLWEGKKTEAFRIINLVNEDYRNLFDTIVKIEEAPRYIDNLLLNVPRRLRDNELLTFRRLIWYKSRDRIDDIINILVDISDTYKVPEKWWSLKRLYGREMLKRGDYKTAYKIISQHNLPTSASDFWEAEWTAGWIALRFLDEPKDALKHFQKMRKFVYQPVTLSRAIYWEAMCYEAMGDKSKAIQTYKSGTNFPIFFYGQLAIHKNKILDPLGSEKDIILPKSPDITGRDIAKISESRAAQIAYILAVSGDRENATAIFEWLVNNAPTDGQIAVIMKIVSEVGDKALDARISRIASKKNVFFVREKFQIVKEVMSDEYAPLVHAIIKQESGFVTSAVSRVGALGYMQLMPGTARLVAKELGIKYDQRRLNTDIAYNVRLGSFYIRKLINEFEGSEILAIASYNAGPNATKRWINEFYDPRKQQDQDKVVDWIELITYSETRNYVQRIIENMIVYKYLMSRTNYDEVR